MKNTRKVVLLSYWIAKTLMCDVVKAKLIDWNTFRIWHNMQAGIQLHNAQTNVQRIKTILQTDYEFMDFSDKKTKPSLVQAFENVRICCSI